LIQNNNNNSNQQPIKDNDSSREELGEPLLPQDVTDEPAVLVQPSPAALTWTKEAAFLLADNDEDREDLIFSFDDTSETTSSSFSAGGRIINNNHNQKIQWKSRTGRKLYLFDFQNKSTRATSQWQNSGMRTILSTSLIVSFIRVSTECLAQYIIS
jgi:hypothetical protein